MSDSNGVPPRYKIIQDLETGDPVQISKWLHDGIYGDSGERFDIVSKWLEQKSFERDLELRSRAEARDIESNESAKEANRIALTANALASRANDTAKIAMYIAITALIIAAWPWIKSIISII